MEFVLKFDWTFFACNRDDLVLARLNFISHFVSQFASLFRSSCRIVQSVFDLISLKRIASSAKSRMCECVSVGRSFM